VTIPNNSTAKVYVPLLGTALTNVIIKESGTTIWQNGAVVGSVDGVEFARFDDALPQQFLVWNVGAGMYQFTWQVAIQVPGGLTANAGDRQVNLSWNPVIGATSYHLKRAWSMAGPFLQVTNVSGVSCADSAVTNGIIYYYAVSAVTTNGESADSAPASAMPVVDLNLGFESKRIGDYQYNPSGAVWAFSGATDNGSGLIANGSGFSNPNAPEGTQAAFVQRLGTMSQTFSGFAPGTTYVIRFAAAQRPGPNQNGGQSWDVKIDGNTIASYNPGASATTYVDYTASFMATATNHTLTFAGSNLAGGDNTVFIDNVRFTPPMPPVVTNLPMVIQSANLMNGRISLSGTAPVGISTVLLTATNLVPPVNWSPLLTNPPNPNGQFTFSNLFTTNLQQFYRVTTP
jgi:hypothetical protein